MPRYPFGTQTVIDNLARRLDAIEATWPMTGSYTRIDPYVVPHMQANQWFEMIVSHEESKAWFDKSWTDYAQLTALQKGFIKPGSVAFDLGCNSGAITLPMAAQAGPSDHVHAFDPHPWNAAATQAQAQLNQLFNVTVHAVGVSNRSHTISVQPNDSRTYESSRGPSAQTLDIRHISAYMTARPTFLKIDTEGAEHDIFDVADYALYASVEWAFLEFHPMWLTPRGVDLRTPLRNIQKHGFELHYHAPDAPVHQIESTTDHHLAFWLRRATV
jgi:FkbM family methyltransferase